MVEVMEVNVFGGLRYRFGRTYISGKQMAGDRWQSMWWTALLGTR